ncbi:GNAT family N-acetyltransferase [Oceanospirillum sediminis]|uniref:GNAT family N-acetyltransferase n=1 Tax=Oceanospirillum sediminis TaxID=2760088 RepID=A0A839IW58_9GAMM|nr:GNAT family N-acetyltransferase [Oceanospirillum sediminis]MBB1488864.1 GNAT family N-acetyltransferase [Oceanospirillum sediminis]
MPDLTVSPEITLSPLSEAEVLTLYHLVRKNHSFLRRSLSWVDSIVDEEDMLRYIRHRVSAYQSSSWYIIRFRGAAAGIIGVKGVVQRQAELSYWLAKDMCKKGLVILSLNFLENQLLRAGRVDLLCFRCEPDNKPSIRVALRTGASYRYARKEMDTDTGEQKIYNIYVKRIRKRASA